MFTGAMARIILRFVAGALVGAGLVSVGAGEFIKEDPDLAFLVAGVLAAVSEGFYALAKKKGWGL